MSRPTPQSLPPPSAPANTYQATGVDAAGAARGLQGLLASLRRTISIRGPGRDGEVLLDFGHYANVIRVGDHGIAVSTDGVGSKILVAEMAGKFDTLGIDLVAMNVNDLLCVGAEPLCMLDYIAVKRVDDRLLAELGVGLEAGAEAAGITIPAGEIAQLPDMLAGADPDQGLDLVGTALGIVAPDRGRHQTGGRQASGGCRPSAPRGRSSAGRWRTASYPAGPRRIAHSPTVRDDAYQ